jgi:hypothetical protein
MSIYNFLKLQWVKRKIIILLIIGISALHLIFASNYRLIQFKAMNILTGDHYYTSFTVMLPSDDEMTGLLAREAKSWTGVANIALFNTQNLIKQLKKDTQHYGLDLPSMVTESKSQLYVIQIDPFADRNIAESVKNKIISHYPQDRAIASPIKYAEINNSKYGFITLFLMEHGVGIFFVMLSLLIVFSNALLFYKMVSDAYILQSIHRSKALSLKNYLYFQSLILIFALTLLIIFTNSVSLLPILIWITVQSILAFVFYGIWGKKAINCSIWKKYILVF